MGRPVAVGRRFLSASFSGPVIFARKPSAEGSRVGARPAPVDVSIHPGTARSSAGPPPRPGAAPIRRVQRLPVVGPPPKPVDSSLGAGAVRGPSRPAPPSGPARGGPGGRPSSEKPGSRGAPPRKPRRVLGRTSGPAQQAGPRGGAARRLKQAPGRPSPAGAVSPTGPGRPQAPTPRRRAGGMASPSAALAAGFQRTNCTGDLSFYVKSRRQRRRPGRR